ncbi:MAG: long-chain fatty acid--CoA ligase [Planctomycetes bacterium]|nr:long-chain fatty acid--CoA ligase [Planctomycetota bacterium]
MSEGAALVHDAPPRRAEHVELVELGGLWIHRSLPALFQQRTAEAPDALNGFHRVGDEWQGESAASSRARVERLAAGLIALGVEPGERVGLISATRWEWPLIDLAILHAGAVTVGIYATLAAGEVKHQLEHPGVRVVIVDRAAQLAKIEGVRDELPQLKRVLSIEPLEGCLDLDGLAALGEGLEDGPAQVAARWQALGPGDLATIIYTSGTTGRPKGAMLSHGNLCYTARAASEVLPHNACDRSLTFLPLAHALQRVATYGGIYSRAQAYYATSVEDMERELRQVAPSIQISVPRIWEKLHARILARVAAAPPSRRRVFKWALEVGRRTSRDRLSGRPLSLRNRLAWGLAREVVITPLKRRIFGGSIKLLTSGGAPIDPQLLEFFFALDLLILEGWGLTETAAPATLNLPGQCRFGTVGRPLRGTEVRQAADGELLVRGPGVFQGYFRDEDATQASFTDEGFFLTGDLGEIDAQGYVKITDRKKDLIVLSTGKKVAPQRIEQVLQSIPLVGNALVHGDQRSYLVALLTLDLEAALHWAVARGVLPPGAPSATGDERDEHLKSIVAHPQFALTLDEAIQERNQALSPFEQLKRWRVLIESWSPAEGTLTPTLKVRRRRLEERYREVLQALYA